MIVRLLDVFLTLVVPAYAIVGVGWALARAPWMPVVLLARFRRLVFDLVLPLYLVRTLAAVELPAEPRFDYLLVYYLVTAGVYAIVAALAWRARGAGVANILGLGAVYANAVLLGVPLVTAALGEAAAVPLFALIALHAPLLATATGVLAELARPERGAGGFALAREVLLGMVRNPIILGIVAGLACNLAFGPLSEPLRARTASFSAVVPVLALLAMGVGLATYRLRSAAGDAFLVAGAKLVLHPLVVAGALALLPGLPALWWQTAVLMAAMPTGVNVYLFAARQGAGEAEAAATVALATPLSMATLTLVIVLIASEA
ncbi:MAG: AEC family transporter [Pseudomonadales bacterium]|nr:AEC family transporter [Pseudomonadales bacterium]